MVRNKLSFLYSQPTTKIHTEDMTEVTMFRRDVLDIILPVDKVTSLENSILEWIQVGWTPTIALPPHTRPPTLSMPFVPLIEAFLPITIYLIIVFIGMFVIRKDRKLLPSNILFFIKFFYNLCQIFLCCYMTVHGISLVIENNFNFFPYFGKNSCNRFDAVNPKMVNLTWMFWMSKILDFMDTILIILNGKVRQFSFLHVYHHITIYSLFWTTIAVTYDGDIFVPLIANSFIHSIMYIYYFLSMHNDNSKPIFWKSYLTLLQLFQFSIMMTHAITNLYFGCSQTAPRQMMIYLAYILSLFLLFVRFYGKSYGKKKNKRKRTSTKDE